MAAKRGKSQARRNSGNRGGLPGWAWLVLGIVLTMVVVLAAPKFFRSGASDGFFRPTPNPDAQPAAASGSQDDDANPPTSDAVATTTPNTPDKPKATKYDFYTMLPGNEVVMSDAELAATAREEAARKAQAQKTANPPDAGKNAVVATANTADTNLPAATATPPATVPPSTTTTVAGPTPAAAANNPIRPAHDAPYILQAGAFGASGDAEAIKAKVALLGLSARVESAAIKGKTVYRVRMGPYATASELSEAKRKLASGGLPALAIKAK